MYYILKYLITCKSNLFSITSNILPFIIILFEFLPQQLLIEKNISGTVCSNMNFYFIFNLDSRNPAYKELTLFACILYLFSIYWTTLYIIHCTILYYAWPFHFMQSYFCKFFFNSKTKTQTSDYDEFGVITVLFDFKR